ncbi:hypothetical protein ABT299_43140 [Spirillospora sp. NPDC000708]
MTASEPARLERHGPDTTTKQGISAHSRRYSHDWEGEPFTHSDVRGAEGDTQPGHGQRSATGASGLWGGLIPFVGPYFSFGFGSTATWDYTSDRLVLSILPAIAVALGGLILMISAVRPVAMVGSWLAIAGGPWFVVGTTIAPLWGGGPGRALGGQTRQIAEHLSFL